MSASADVGAQGFPLQEIYGHSGRVFDVAFSPDSSKVATASEDTTARVWRVTDGASTSLLSGHTAEVLRVAWRPDGELISTGGFKCVQDRSNLPNTSSALCMSR
jgi:WD40 repeat protein